MIAQTQVRRQKTPWKDHWHTPKSVLDIVREVFHGTISLDPASDDTNPTGAASFFTPEDNGLEQQWTDLWFLNPPFSNKQPWIQKAVSENKIGIALLPAACQHNKGTRALVRRATAIAPLGRVAFIPSPSLIKSRIAEGLQGHPSSPPDDMLLLYFGPSEFRFNHVLDGCGYPVYRPVSLCRGWR